MSEGKNALGIDIGGTKTLYGIINEKGEIVSELKKIPTAKDANEIFNTLKQIVNENYDKIDAVGISSAGAVNIENTRVVSSTPNLPKGYNNIDFATLCNKKVYVENDANCACFAEYKIGAGQGYRTVLTITLGTGIGGGLVYEGKLFRGATGNALEVGSMKIPAFDVFKCTCGRNSCWEAYGSGTGLKKIAIYVAEKFGLTNSLYKDKKPNDITTYDIVDGIQKNDEYSKKVFDMWVECIKTGLTSLTNIFNPDCVVVSGGMCQFIDVEKLQEDINKESVVSNTTIKLAQTGNDAGMIGAALLALQ